MDVLNIIGLSMVLMGVFCRVVQGRAVRAVAAAGASLFIALLTPLLWTTARPRFLPWFLESYVNGVHTFDVPQPWLFPIFPWTAFAFAGLAAGWVLSGDWARRREAAFASSLGASGACLAALGWAFDALPYRLYSAYDFWHTSPSFFLIRMGLLLMLVAVCFVWCRWGAGLWGFSPMIQLGKTSLLVYWVHIEFVYGRFSILPKRGVGVGTASLGLLVIFLAMVLLSLGRTRWKGSGAKVRSGFAPPASQQAG